MSDFNTAVEHIIIVEGGDKFSNRKEDLGGPTRWGITQKTYSEWKGSFQSIEKIRNMPKADAIAIYRDYYWNPMNLTGLPFTIQIILFDQGVNRGPLTAVMNMQKVLGLREDGILGPITKKAIKERDEESLSWEFLKESLRDYIVIAQRNPSQLANLMGWTNRILNLTDAFLAP